MDTKRHLLPTCAASLLVLAVAQAARAQAQPVSVGGATLFNNFFTGAGTQASTNDFIDVDGDGFYGFHDSGPTAVQQLAPVASYPTDGSTVSYQGSSGFVVRTQQWYVEYRATGSVGGIQELFNTQAGLANPFLPLATAVSSNGAWVNSTRIVGTSATGSFAQFVSSSTASGSPTATPISGVDVAVSDVQSVWGLQAAGTSGWNKKPGQAGYGTNAVLSSTNYANLLVNRTVNGVTFQNSGTGSHVLYDTPIAIVPINPIANPGVGLDQIKASELQYLQVTGRMPTGENLQVSTRSVQSGTRNAFANSLGIDPSFATGENTGNEATGDNFTKLGAQNQVSNMSGTGDVEKAVRNNRLAIGYVGTDTAGGASTNGAGTQYGSMKVNFNLSDTANTAYVAPTLNAILHNQFIDNSTASGWQIGGNETFITDGDPNATNWAGNTSSNSYTISGNQTMSNSNAALYVRNITESIKQYVAHNATASADLFMPGQYLADNFILRAAPDYVQSASDATSWIANPDKVQALQDAAVANASLIAKYNPKLASDVAVGPGIVPNRSSSAIPYSDGSTTGSYTFYDSSLAAHTVAGGARLNERNRVSGDFNGTGVRNIDQIPELMAAVANPAAWAQAHNNGTETSLTVTSTAAIPEILGDFNGDGNFDSKDVRYFADGLAIATSGPHAGKLDIKAGFTAVDLNSSSNYFGTTKATPQVYANGDSRGDVAGSVGGPHAGSAPTGADGIINTKDLDYVAKQTFSAHGTSSDGSFATLLARAVTDPTLNVRADLSADINGDLKLDGADIVELEENILGTPYGDINLNGIVNIQDIAIVANHWQLHNQVWDQGDLNGDGIVNIQDFSIVANHWQQHASWYVPPPGGGGGSQVLSTPVPEPASLILLGATGAALLIKRRRHRTTAPL